VNFLKGFIREIKINKFLYLLTLPGVLFLIVFHYIPMAGIVIAFQKFNPLEGIFNSPFVGFDNFKFFFQGKNWMDITFNTFYLNILFTITGTIASVFISIMVSENNGKIFKKSTQSLMILPNFVSWAIVAMFSVTLFSSDMGIINQFLRFMKLEDIKFYNDANIWPTILVIMRIWKGAGFGAIVYIATITGFDQSMYEAALIDGASRFQCIFKITIPLLLNTIIIMTILGIGNIFRGDFGMIYTLVGDNNLLFKTTDVIDTYVYRSLRSSGEMGMSAAVGLYQSVLGFLMVIISNAIAKKYSAESAIF
jgi:putative aldouronate transport system permease protein